MIISDFAVLVIFRLLCCLHKVCSHIMTRSGLFILSTWWCKKATCPLENHCLTPSIVYNAKVTTTEDPIGKNYIGLTEGPFKQRYTQHTLSFRNRHYANSTELSKFIWLLKDNNTDFKIKWSILTSAAAYCNKSKRCNLCLAEKFFIIKAEKSTLLNKRSELVSKCRHENKFYLMNLKADHT